jgi:hypothetical protein
MLVWKVIVKKSELSQFYVVAVCSNPARYASRYRLFKKFMQEMHDAGAQLVVVECRQKNRSFMVSDSKNPLHLQVTASSEIWIKENLINLGIRHLSKVRPNWKYIAFIDGDISFVKSHFIPKRENWISETVEALQTYHVVQMFQTAIDLGSDGQTFGKYEGFGWAYAEDRFNPNTYKYTSFHPGYAWALRRSAYLATGGLIDTSILGAGDRHMAYGWVGMIKASIDKGLNPHYGRALLEWEARAEKYIHRDVGFVPGTIVHHWHGKKRDRRYQDRWKILIETQFDPVTDLKSNEEGLLELVVMSPRQIRLRDLIRRYLRARNEDSVDQE